MLNDVNYCTDDNLIYECTAPVRLALQPVGVASLLCFAEPVDESLQWIEWDDLENAWIDNLGFCYKSFQDIKENFAIYWDDNPKLNRYYLLLL